MATYDRTRSEALLSRAREVIPGGLYGHYAGAINRMGLVGSDALKEAAQKVFYIGTQFFNAVPMAAAKANPLELQKQMRQTRSGKQVRYSMTVWSRLPVNKAMNSLLQANLGCLITDWPMFRWQHILHGSMCALT